MTTYTITVVTGNRDYAGTDANVFIRLFGERGTSDEFFLDDGEDNFERGKTDVFGRQASDLGDIKQVRIRHDNSGNAPGWFLENIIVRNEDTGKEWLARCHRWLARDEEDGKVDRTLKAVPWKGE